MPYKQVTESDYKVLTQAHYQSKEVAAAYKAEYDGPFRIHKLPARIVAIREEAIIARLLHKIQGQVNSVLDLPCGTGKLGRLLIGRIRRVVAADISMEMMETGASVYSKAMGFAGFVQSDATSMAFPDLTFDLVICLRLLHRVPPGILRQILRESTRVSKRYVIVSAGIISPWHQFRGRLSTALTGAVSLPYPIRDSMLRAEIEAVGLRIIACHRILPAFSTESILFCERA